MADELRRVANGPDGIRYEVIGRAKDWRLGTGSVLLDAAAFLWAAVRNARGKEWVVTVRPAGTRSDLAALLVRTREEAVSSVAELAEAVESGQLTPPAE